MADIRATPVSNRAAYYLAGLLDSANEAVSKPFGYENDPVRGLTNLLGVPSIVKTLENVAYGMPNTTGAGMATQLRPEAKETVANLLPMAPGAAKVAAKGAIEAGKYAAPKVGQMAEQYAVKTGLLNPMIAYHGSPYSFDAFDLAHVGKGEGAQAYGHGMYFAESPEVAGGYREKLSRNVFVGGKKLESFPTDSPLAAAQNKVVTSISNGMSPAEAIADTVKYWETAADEMHGFLKSNPELADRIKAEAASRQAIADAAKKLNPNDFYRDPGFLYKVDIPDPAVATFLDWDKPLSQQPKHIQAAIQQTRSMLPSNAIDDLGGDLSLLYGKDVTPNQFLNTWEAITGSTGSGEKALQNAGVQGIRYLDGGSRGAGAGTSNFVVFDPSIVKILERNGQPMGLLETPFDKAHKVAQENATKMLGLPPNNTAMDRARALGFDMSEYHGTSAGDFPAFDPSKMKDNVQYGGFIYTTKDPAFASRVAESGWSGNSPTVMPVMIRSGKKFDMAEPVTAEDAANVLRVTGQHDRAAKIEASGRPYRNGAEFFYWGTGHNLSNPARGAAINKAGFDVITGDPALEIAGTPGKPQTAIFDSSRIRSRFAAFDPARINEPDLLAAGIPLGLIAGSDIELPKPKKAKK